MAWRCVGLIKNDLNEYKFAVIPNIEAHYSGGTNNTIFRIGGMRGAGQFTIGEPYARALNAQDGIFRLEEPNPASTNEFVYSTVAGSALNLRINVSRSSPFDRLEIQPYLYKNMAQYRQLNNTTAFMLIDTSKTSFAFWTWALLLNDETEECYLGCVYAGITWEYAIEQPASGDYAEVLCYVCDSGGKDGQQNLYSTFKDSIPGGGGGGEPYIGGGTSTSGGGENATFDLTSDDIDVPMLPTISASGAGLLTLYQVSMQNMIDFANYLWSPLFDVDTLKKLFNDPMDAIISLGMLPFTPTGGGTSNIFIGTSDSGVSATRLSSQYYELDMGSVLLDTFYDSALDLNPYTKVDLYLPFCGTVNINPDEFDGKSIHVVYHVDILTGACVVFIEDGSRVLLQSQGNVLTAIPYTAKDFKSIFGAVLGDAAAAGAAIGALATGGISAVAGGIGLVSHVALNTVNSKVNTPHGGQCASTAGFLSIQKPYLIITRPAQCLPEDNAAYQGYPAYITETVGDLSGFIKISEAHFDGFTCTDGELKEIDRLLKEGVYVQ